MHNRGMSDASHAMALEPAADLPIRASIDRVRYRAQQYGLAMSLALPGRFWNFVLSPGQQRFSVDVLKAVQQRYEALLEQDLANVARGYYPRELLYQFPLFDYLRKVPEVLLDVPRFLLRS